MIRVRDSAPNFILRWTQPSIGSEKHQPISTIGLPCHQATSLFPAQNCLFNSSSFAFQSVYANSKSLVALT
jgi:hypothetical protein